MSAEVDSGRGVAVFFGIAFSCAILGVYYACCRRKKDSGYRHVDEGEELDEEEQEFKRQLEEQGHEFNPNEELEFDDTDLDHLRMIEQYREDILETDSGGKEPAVGETGETDERVNAEPDEASVTIEMIESERSTKDADDASPNSCEPPLPNDKKTAETTQKDGQKS